MVKESLECRLIVKVLNASRFRESVSVSLNDLKNAVLVWQTRDGTVLNVIDLAGWHHLLLR
jgi:hypothetical protein